MQPELKTKGKKGVGRLDPTPFQSLGWKEGEKDANSSSSDPTISIRASQQISCHQEGPTLGPISPPNSVIHFSPEHDHTGGVVGRHQAVSIYLSGIQSHVLQFRHPVLPCLPLLDSS
jgi:hypothetical protein